MRLMEGDQTGPINIGNPGEFTMVELAETVKEVRIVFVVVVLISQQIKCDYSCTKINENACSLLNRTWK